MRGVDVSSHQSVIDWPAVAAAGYAFAVTKATEGFGWTDPTFQANWAGIKAAGLRRGAYCFVRPELGNGPQAEAQWFCSTVQPAPDDLLVLDIESEGASGDLSGWALAWLAHVEQVSGIRPLVYSYAPYLRSRGLCTPALAAYKLWLAAYQAQPPACPWPWQSYVMWQHTSTGSVPGIGGNVDCNICYDERIWAGGPSVAPEDQAIVDLVRSLGGDAASVQGWIEQLGAQAAQMEALRQTCQDAAALLRADIADGRARVAVARQVAALLEGV